MQMHIYKVGELYNPRVTRWPEVAQYSFRGGGHELVLFFEEPSAAEIQGVKNGTKEFGLLSNGDDIVILWKIAGCGGWSDSHFSWWKLPLQERSLPNPEPGPQERALLHILLVDASSGILRAQSACTLSPDFTAALHNLIRQQAKQPPTSYDSCVAEYEARFPDPRSALADAIARCRSGD